MHTYHWTTADAAPAILTGGFLLATEASIMHQPTDSALIILDMDGTLVASYMDRPDKNFAAVDLLPNVRATLDQLRRSGCAIRVVTNQGGVAFGHNRAADVVAKLRRVAVALDYGGIEIHDGGPPHTHDTGAAAAGTLQVHVCYADARSPSPRYNDRRAARRRKPSGAMITEALAGTDRSRALYVGDRPEDEAAAQDAGVAFCWAADFFGWS